MVTGALVVCRCHILPTSFIEVCIFRKLVSFFDIMMTKKSQIDGDLLACFSSDVWFGGLKDARSILMLKPDKILSWLFLYVPLSCGSFRRLLATQWQMQIRPVYRSSTSILSVHVVHNTGSKENWRGLTTYELDPCKFNCYMSLCLLSTPTLCLYPHFRSLIYLYCRSFFRCKSWKHGLVSNVKKKMQNT